MEANSTRVLVEYELDDNVISVEIPPYPIKKSKYMFCFRNKNSKKPTVIQSTYSSAKGVMKKFNSAVKALKSGINIK